jgi:hypothetical protein
MHNEPPHPTWDALSYGILTGMHEWRLQHPDATLNEIEQALDECWYRVRACLLEDPALQREAAWQAKAADRMEAACAGGRPTCRPPWPRIADRLRRAGLRGCGGRGEAPVVVGIVAFVNPTHEAYRHVEKLVTGGASRLQYINHRLALAMPDER